MGGADADEPRFKSAGGGLQIIVAERGPLVFVFNFSPFNDYEGYKVNACADSDAPYGETTVCVMSQTRHSSSLGWAKLAGLLLGSMTCMHGSTGHTCPWEGSQVDP